jgi:hypothetical protein
MRGGRMGFIGKATTSDRVETRIEALETRVLLSADPVLSWNDAVIDSLRALGPGGPAAGRPLAIVQTAVYDAVNAIAHDGHRGYLYNQPAPRITSVDAAVAQAAHDALTALYPTRASIYDAKLADDLAAVPDGPGERFGVALGKLTAKLVLDNRADDGSAHVVTYTPLTGTGYWQPTPPAFAPAIFPQWPGVTPFVLNSADQFRPDPPPALNSPEYTAAFNEVKTIGAKDSTTRTADQTQIARFWLDGGGTPGAQAHWNKIAQQVSVARGLTVPQEARLFALLGMAELDASVACWDGKFAYNLWRPITGINHADTDGNPDTTADAAWAPLLATPAHPSYASGHSTVSAASATVLARFFGTDDVSFTSAQQNDPSIVRSYTSFTQAAEEAGMSRIYGGFHWQFDNTAGQKCGRLVGNYVMNHVLTDRHDDDHDDGGHGRGGDDHDGRGDEHEGRACDLVTGAIGGHSILGTANAILA